MRWYSPATWGSHAPAAAVDKATRNESVAEQAAIKQAQKSIHETEIALAAAAFSRPVEVARDSNTTAAVLLDQAVGPLQASELAALRRTVSGLLSDNAQTRASAEKAHAQDLVQVSAVSAQLAAAQLARDNAQSKLRVAFDRENQLANELRSAHALHWILGGCAVLALLGWTYVRFFLGGIPGAFGQVMARLETRNPAAAAEVRDLVDAATNRHEQTTLRNAYLKAR